MQIQYRSCRATVPVQGLLHTRRCPSLEGAGRPFCYALTEPAACAAGVFFPLLFPLLFQLSLLSRLAENLGTLHYNRVPFNRPTCRAWMEIDGKEF